MGDGRIVRSWPMRGTLHVTRPDDLRLLLSLTAARTIRTIARRGVERGIDDEVLAVARRRARAVVGDTVEDLGGGLVDLADRPALGPVPTAHLLPGFDEHVLGYADRSAQLDPTVADRIVPGGNGVFLPTVVVRGRTVGTWTRQGAGRTARLVVTPFAPLDPAAVRALVAVGERHGRWLGKPTEVVVA